MKKKLKLVLIPMCMLVVGGCNGALPETEVVSLETKALPESEIVRELESETVNTEIEKQIDNQMEATDRITNIVFEEMLEIAASLEIENPPVYTSKDSEEKEDSLNLSYISETGVCLQFTYTYEENSIRLVQIEKGNGTEFDYLNTIKEVTALDEFGFTNDHQMEITNLLQEEKKETEINGYSIAWSDIDGTFQIIKIRSCRYA